MNKIKTTLLTSLILLSFLNSNAQNGFKEPVTFKLKNGMTVIVSENNRSDKAFSSFTLDTKAFQNKKDGVVELLNAVLNEGAQKNDHMSFKDNSGKLAVSALDFDADLTAFASNIEHAQINQKTFNVAKAKLITSLKLQDYDYDQTVTEESINALSLSDVQDFYNEITPDKTYLTIAGDVNVNDAKNSAKKAFGNWIKTENNTIASLSK
ncbi:peptidase M16 family protein [Pedobacter paludis]|uniref:Peptidase M16 C-terminal domain-containing protein n=1 Tax=Pedobacter paludis TaxID=2203212 RepID=A0A317EWV9_9SPHI|nr:insulinase family protein [Pedobacter paludis]PWS31430.1 hypothetical protein DF947_12580 [Pedobacter paludis]